MEEQEVSPLQNETEKKSEKTARRFTPLKISLIALACAGLAAVGGERFVRSIQNTPDPITGITGDLTKTQIGDAIAKNTARLQAEHVRDRGAETKDIIDAVLHLSPRFLIRGGYIRYLQEFASDRLSPPLKYVPFSHEYTQHEIDDLPEWTQNPQVAYKAYRDKIGQNIDTVAIDLNDASIDLLMAWKELGYLASPNLYLGWPDPDTRNENVASLGSDPLFSHANGVGWRISLPNNLSFVLGGGWLTRSPAYPYQEETNGTSISQEYGLIKPNNHAMPATAIVEIKNGSVVVQHEAAGDIYDKHSPPVFLYASNGSIRVMNADEYREVVMEQKKQLPDGCIIQIAFALSVSQEGLDSLNTASRNPVNRPVILDSLQKDLEPLNLPSLDISWVIHATTSEGRQLVVLSLNRDKQSERAAGEYKIIAGINTLLESANLKPNERFTSLSIIHTGQQGSTGNTAITRGNAQSKTANNTSASLQEFLSKLSK